METTLLPSGLTLNLVGPVFKYFSTVFHTDVERSDQYAPLCTVQGDLSDICFQTLSEPETNQVYYSYEYFVELCFEESELSVYFQWQNNEVLISSEFTSPCIAYCYFRGIGGADLPQLSTIHLTLYHRAVQ